MSTDRDELRALVASLEGHADPMGGMPEDVLENLRRARAHLANTLEPTCSCAAPGSPSFEGPEVDCDVHGSPSHAFRAGHTAGTREAEEVAHARAARFRVRVDRFTDVHPRVRFYGGTPGQGAYLGTLTCDPDEAVELAELFETTP